MQCRGKGCGGLDGIDRRSHAASDVEDVSISGAGWGIQTAADQDPFNGKGNAGAVLLLTNLLIDHRSRIVKKRRNNG